MRLWVLIVTLLFVVACGGRVVVDEPLCVPWSTPDVTSTSAHGPFANDSPQAVLVQRWGPFEGTATAEALNARIAVETCSVPTAPLVVGAWTGAAEPTGPPDLASVPVSVPVGEYLWIGLRLSTSLTCVEGGPEGGGAWHWDPADGWTHMGDLTLALTARGEECYETSVAPP